MYSYRERAGRPLDADFVDWFSKVPASELSEWLCWIGSFPGVQLPAIRAGSTRPFISAPSYSPTPLPGGPDWAWREWWHRGISALLLTSEVALTEPLVPALRSAQISEPGNPARLAVRGALNAHIGLRDLADAGIVHWTDALAELGLLREARLESVLPPRSLKGRRKLRPEFAEALALAETCRRASHMQPLIRGKMTPSELSSICKVLSKTSRYPTFVDLCRLDLNLRPLQLRELVGLRLSSESLAEFRASLEVALARLPARLRGQEWSRNAAGLIHEALEPSREAVRKELRTSTALGALRSASESIAFSICGIGVGAQVGGSIAAPAIAAAATAATMKSSRDFVAGLRARRSRVSYLRTLTEFSQAL